MRFLVSLAFLFSAFWSSNALAITINAGSSPYDEVIVAQGVTINSEAEVREAAMFGLVGKYRAIHGVYSIPLPSEVEIVYDDGSKEKAVVTCIAGSNCVLPKPNSKQPAPSGSGGGSGSSSGYGGGAGTPGCVAGCDDLYGDVGEVEPVPPPSTKTQ